MNQICPDLCPQSQRALRLLIDPNKPQIDRQKLIALFPSPMPRSVGGILDVIIQLMLALCEGKDGPAPMPPPK